MAAATSNLPPDAGEALLTRMRSGDREAVGQFMLWYGPYIRRRVRGKITPSMRRLFDTQELLSTLGRRLDRYVQVGRFRAMDDAQLWALIFRMVENAVLDKHRVMRRLHRTEGEDSPLAQSILARMVEGEQDPQRGAENELSDLLSVLRSPVDRHIVALWLNGHSLRQVGDYLDLSADAVRQRWRGIRQQLRECLENRT